MTWETKPLSDVGFIQGGIQKSSKRAVGEGEGAPFLRVANVTPRGLDLTEVHRIGVTPDELAKLTLVRGDLLVVEGNGSASQIGRAAMWDGSIDGCVHQNHLIRVRPLPTRVLPKFLELVWNSPAIRSALTAAASSSSGLHTLSVSKLKRITIPVPPLDEQRRIVELVEEHLSHLDAADAALAQAAQRGKALQGAALAQAAHGTFVPLPQLGRIQGGLQKTSRRAVTNEAGAPFLRVANVTAEGLDLSEVHQIAVTAAELEKLRLDAGDLLVVEGNGSASQIGRAATWDGSIPDCVHQNHLIRVRPDPTVILPEYLEIAWNAPATRAALAAVASSSSGLYTLSVSKLRTITLPTPSLHEQRDAVARTSNTREALRRLAASQQAARRRSAALRRAVLAAAFSGRLTGHASDAEVIAELAVP